MRILFIGTVEFSKRILEKLIELNCNIVSVLTKEKSKYNSDFVNLSELCIRNNLEYKYFNNINEFETIKYIKSKEPDIIFCFGLSQLIGKELLNIPPMGVLGYHPALLPQNRGRHPIIWALALGLKETGSTFFFMNEDADSGDILSQEKIEINYSDDAKSLYEKITSIALKQVENFIPLLENGTYKTIKQDNVISNYWRKRSEKDGEIDWRMSSYTIYNLVRALTRPYPGAYFFYKNKKVRVWKVNEVRTNRYDNLEPGKVIKNNNGVLLIKAGDNCIEITDCDLGEIIMEGEYL